MDYINYVKQAPVQGVTGLYGGVQGSLMAAAPTGGGGGGAGAWYGDRGVWGGGYPNTEVLQYVAITTPANAVDFGDMIQATRARAPASGGGSASRGLYMGGRSSSPGPDTGCEYITIGTTGNGTDFGDIISPSNGGYIAGASNGTYAYAVGGNCCGGGIADIQYFTIASTSNATDHGDMTAGRYGAGGTNNGTYAVIGGTQNGTAPQNSIDYFSMGTSGNGSDFGDLTKNRAYTGAFSNSTGRAIFYSDGGDDSSTSTNQLDYFAIGTSGTAADFGDMTSTRGWCCDQMANATHGLIAGGQTPSGALAAIDYVAMASTSNATDFGDLLSAMTFAAGLSGT